TFRVKRTHLPVSILLLHDPAPTEIYTLSLHDALPICYIHFDFSPKTKMQNQATYFNTRQEDCDKLRALCLENLSYRYPEDSSFRSEEHTSELQSRENLVCRLLLEKKKQKNK